MTQTKILVVEDESIVARDIQSCVSELGYQSVGWAASGEEAIEKTAEIKPDLVLMDVRLPGGMDGISAAEEIRNRFQIPVVFLTAMGDNETLERAKLSGPFGYVLKPFVPSDLRLAIEFGVCRHQLECDLTEAHQELAEQKGFMDALFNTIPSSVMVIDENRRIRMVNQGLEQTFGVALEAAVDSCPGDALGCPFALDGSEECGTLEECVRCQLREPTVEALAGETISRKSCEFTFFAGGQEHKVVLLVSAMPLDYRGERLAIVILEDVTELAGLRRLLHTEKSFAGIVGNTPEMHAVFESIREVADADVPVMVLGESGSMTRAPDRARNSCRSTAAPCRTASWKASSSVTSRARSRARSAIARDDSSWPTAGPSSWTRWRTSAYRCRSSSSVFFRRAPSSGSVEKKRSRSTYGWSVPPTRTSRPRSQRAASARISTTVSAWCRSRCPHSERGSPTCRFSPSISSSARWRARVA